MRWFIKGTNSKILNSTPPDGHETAIRGFKYFTGASETPDSAERYSGRWSLQWCFPTDLRSAVCRLLPCESVYRNIQAIAIRLTHRDPLWVHNCQHVHPTDVVDQVTHKKTKYSVKKTIHKFAGVFIFYPPLFLASIKHWWICAHVIYTLYMFGLFISINAVILCPCKSQTRNESDSSPSVKQTHLICCSPPAVDLCTLSFPTRPRNEVIHKQDLVQRNTGNPSTSFLHPSDFITDPLSDLSAVSTTGVGALF